MNLGYRQPATAHWPLYGYPPPHFLVGYQYLIKVCNEYIFDTRAYSRLKYIDLVSSGTQLINWSLMSNCTYTVNTGAYHRFIDFDNFEETLTQVQQAILADRVVTDLAALRPLRGYGITNIENYRNVPVEQLLHEQSKDINQHQVLGIADRIRLHQSGKKDLVILSTIRKLKTAYFNYLVSNEEKKLSLPCDSDWIYAFMELFSNSVDGSSLQTSSLPVQKITKSMISALSLPNNPNEEFKDLSGGAFELRPREGGRAVTEAMRRNRGEMIERFVDTLPIRRRRRRAPVAAVEEEIRTFEDEVRAAVSEVIRLLEEELTVTARNGDFFNFPIHFYMAMSRLDAMGEITESALRRWVMYFFVTEHIATTLNYLHHSLRNNRLFTRNVDLNLAQVVMRARNNIGQVVYNRIWNETGQNAFVGLIRRISVDLSATVERAGMELDDEDIEQFMSDIAFHDNSGDVQEIIRQAEMNDAEIESVDISFRFKVTGPVIFSQNREIQNINKRVVNYATSLRQQRLEMPALNQVIDLPRI